MVNHSHLFDNAQILIFKKKKKDNAQIWQKSLLRLCLTSLSTCLTLIVLEEIVSNF